MSDINYKKLYEESIFEKINLQKEYEDLKKEFQIYKEDMINKINEYELNTNELKEKLKKYTAPKRNKTFYEKNSDIVKEKAKNYMEKIKETNPEKLKEWRHQAYLNRKAKLKAQQKNK